MLFAERDPRGKPGRIPRNGIDLNFLPVFQHQRKGQHVVRQDFLCNSRDRLEDFADVEDAGERGQQLVQVLEATQMVKRRIAETYGLVRHGVEGASVSYLAALAPYPCREVSKIDGWSERGWMFNWKASVPS